MADGERRVNAKRLLGHDRGRQPRAECRAALGEAEHVASGRDRGQSGLVVRSVEKSASRTAARPPGPGGLEVVDPELEVQPVLPGGAPRAPCGGRCRRWPAPDAPGRRASGCPRALVRREALPEVGHRGGVGDVDPDAERSGREVAHGDHRSDPPRLVIRVRGRVRHNGGDARLPRSGRQTGRA